MKTVTVTSDQAELTRLVEEAYSGEPVILAYGDKAVRVQRHTPNEEGAIRDLEEDSVELENELLKGVRSPFSHYSQMDLETIIERVRREKTGA